MAENYDVSVYDIDVDTISARANSNVKILLHRNELRNEQYDLITCNLVLCCVSNDVAQEIISDINAALKNSGKAIISICNPLFNTVQHTELRKSGLKGEYRRSKYFEKLTGQRMMYNYFVFGGLRKDIDYLEDVQGIINILPEKIDDYEKIITDNPIFLKRTEGKGILDKETALNYAITGVNLRASGVDLDFRNADYLYKGFDFRTIVLEEKDSWARYKARIMEMRESCNIIHQALEYLKTAPTLEQRLINPLNLKLPEGDYSAQIEAPRGLASCFIRSDGGDKPYRLKWRTGSYYSVNLLRKLLVGEYLNDAIAIAGSLDFILPEVDK